MKKEEKISAARIVSSSILGLDFRVVVIAGERYVINPPTIHKLAGAAYHLDNIANADTVADVITNQSNIESIAKALSWLIFDNEKMATRLQKGTLGELSSALKEAYSLISVQDFLTLSALARNVVKMVANQKQ